MYLSYYLAITYGVVKPTSKLLYVGYNTELGSLDSSPGCREKEKEEEDNAW